MKYVNLFIQKGKSFSMRTDVDYRLKEHRFEGFDYFYRFMLDTKDWSPDINVESWIADDLDFDFEKRCTMALFHGATYAGPCETMFSDLFPTFNMDVIDSAVEFFYDNKKRLLFSPDCKYRKIVFEKFLRSVAQATRKTGSLGNYIKKSFQSDPITNYLDLKTRCQKDWFHWGRMGHWCFSEALTKFVNAPILPPTMEFDEGASHRSGWAFCVGADHLVDGKVSKKDILWLEKSAMDYVSKINHPDAGFLSLETACCNYKRQHKGSRYGGCYIDEQLWEMDYMKKLWPEYQWLWDKYLEGRAEVIPHAVLAEKNLHHFSSESAYLNSWNKVLKDYGRIPRVEAWFNKQQQVWHDAKLMEAVWT